MHIVHDAIYSNSLKVVLIMFFTIISSSTLANPEPSHTVLEFILELFVPYRLDWSVPDQGNDQSILDI